MLISQGSICRGLPRASIALATSFKGIGIYQAYFGTGVKQCEDVGATPYHHLGVDTVGVSFSDQITQEGQKRRARGGVYDGLWGSSKAPLLRTPTYKVNSGGGVYGCSA